MYKRNIYIIKLFIITISLLLFSCSESKENNDWEIVNRILENISEPVFQNKDFLLTDYAGHDLLERNFKEYLEKAIFDCSKNGGGRVVIPKGKYFSKGPIVLLSNVNLHFEDSTQVLFSTDPNDYLPVVFTRWEGVECYNYSPLIYAYDQSNIAITGNVIFNGQADSTNWWPWKGKENYSWKVGMPSQQDSTGRPLLMKMNEKQVEVEKRVFGDNKYLRPNFIQFYKCRNVMIDGATVINSPMWLIHPVLSENVIIRNVKAISFGPNNDGCNPESCKNVLIEDCVFNNGDDCIAIKSGRNEDGRRINVPSENIIIRNCKMKDGHGGVVIGSEISGGCRYVFTENCEMDSPNLERALRIKTNSFRGGVVENIYMRNVQVGEVSNAVVHINMLYEPEEGIVGNYLPIVRNIFVEKIRSQKSKYALELIGLDNSTIENINVIDSEFNGAKMKNSINNVKDLKLTNVKINGENISE